MNLPNRAESRNPTTRVPEEASRSPLEKLRAFLDDLNMKTKTGPRSFADFEKELHARVLEFERDVIAAEMVKADVDVPAIEVEGKVHRRVLSQSQRYMTTAGEVEVHRTLYKDRSDEEGRCVSPMELTLGVVGGFWTPRAASQALWVVTQLTPKKSEELFERVGSMQPSKSSIDRLPKLVSEQWERGREEFEERLRDGFELPEGTTSIAVSLDGVLAPIDGGRNPVDVRIEAAHEGRTSQGPAGYREASCASISFCDAKGELLGAIRMARAPESKKATLNAMLTAEVEGSLRRDPSLRIVKVADGAKDNWTYLSSSALPPGAVVIDFFHACEHLHVAIASVYGDGTHETRYRYATLKDTLRDETDGVNKVIRALKHLADKHPRKSEPTTELAYFRKNRKRMQYARLRDEGLTIGSGVVEAACKTLVTQRLKQSGMRWSTAGAQAILTPRGWDQSERFDEAWAMVAATFQTEVTVFANVVAMRPRKEPGKPRGSASR